MQFPTTNSGVSLVIDLEFIAKVEFLMNDFTKVKTIIMMASIIIRLYQQNSTVALFRTPDPVRSFYMVRFAGERGPLAKKNSIAKLCADVYKTFGMSS